MRRNPLIKQLPRKSVSLFLFLIISWWFPFSFQIYLLTQNPFIHHVLGLLLFKFDQLFHFRESYFTIFYHNSPTKVVFVLQTKVYGKQNLPSGFPKLLLFFIHHIVPPKSISSYQFIMNITMSRHVIIFILVLFFQKHKPLSLFFLLYFFINIYFILFYMILFIIQK